MFSRCQITVPGKLVMLFDTKWLLKYQIYQMILEKDGVDSFFTALLFFPLNTTKYLRNFSTENDKRTLTFGGKKKKEVGLAR